MFQEIEAHARETIAAARVLREQLRTDLTYVRSQLNQAEQIARQYPIGLQDTIRCALDGLDRISAAMSPK